ncbi:MAG: T9SS type A sorting domain-containing protein, partial [Bacteroidia bacterium]|nr:T9SS type A sorting domain-containing protein [Bacteroidia bacterium]
GGYGNPGTFSGTGVSGNVFTAPTVSVPTNYTITYTFGYVSQNQVITVNPIPNVSASISNTTVCSGTTLSLSGSGASTYTWTGGISNGVPFSATSNATYNVTGTSSAGCVANNTAVVSVSVNPNPTITVNSGSICSGKSFTIVPSGASTYTYSSGSAIVAPNTNTSINVTGTSAQGCVSSNTAVSSITVNASPTIAVNSGSICSGKSFTITPSGASSYTYSSGSAIVAPNTNTTVNVTGTSAQGCVSSNTAVSSISVNATPTITVNSGTICSGQSFSIAASGASTYTYSSGSAIVAPTSNTSINVTGTSAQGCVSSNTAVSSVSVNASPTITVNSGTICSGQSFTVTPSGATTYTYSSGSAIVAPTSNTTINVTGTSAQGCVSSNTAVSSVTVYTRPTISANNPTICSGQQATITVQGGVPVCIIGPLSTSSVYISTFTTSTAYTISGISAQGCASSNTITTNITVNNNPLITVNSGSICAGQSFTIVPTGASTYTFLNGSAVITPITNTIINVIGTSSLGCVSSNTALSIITVASSPSISALGSATSVCLGQTSATLTANGANSYSWSTGATTQSIVVSPTATINYSVTGTATNGCSTATTIALAVNPLPSITALANPSFICLGATSTLSASGAGTYNWSNGASSASTAVSPTLNNAIYTVTGTTSQGCFNVVLVAVFTNSNQITTTPASTVCSGTNLTLSANGAVTYTWNGTQFSQSISITPTSSAVYSVTGTDSNNCVLSKTVSVGVYQLPNVISTINNSIICLGESATLTASGASTYSWSTGVSGNSIVVTPTVPLSFTYQVTGTDVNNCVATNTSSLTVFGCLGIEAMHQSVVRLVVYPNPNNGEFSINGSEDLTLTIVNELGQHLKTVELNTANNYNASVSDLPNGIYFIIGSGNREVVKQKIIVSK